MLKIESYTLRDLEGRLRSGDLWRGEVLPTTKHRTLSQVRNPRALPEDLALLVAYDNDRVVGYIGVLPDFVFLNGQKRRIGWLTGWWADPDPKHAGIGLMLMVKALKAYDGEVGASGFSEGAKKAYEASKLFLKTEESVRLKAFLRLNTRELLPRKFPVLKNAKLLLGVFDFLLNIVCDLRLRVWRLRFGTGKQLRLEYIAEVDSETADFIRELERGELSRRGAAEITWISQYPWVLCTPLGNSGQGNFYFSATARESDCFLLKVFSPDDVMIGFIMLRLIDDHLTVPIFYTLEQHTEEVFRVIAEHAVALRANALTLGRSELRRSLTRVRLPCVARIERSTRWILGKVYETTLLGELEPQDGDGDCAFWS